MIEFIKSLASSDFMPHGHCYLWRTDLLWLHVGSDSLIALSFFSIPFALLYFAKKREGLEFKKLILLFGAFILACGFTHLMNIWSVWNGMYYISGFFKLVTAFISVVTAISIWPYIPKALTIPAPDELKQINATLQKEIAERELIEQQLRMHQDELEALVYERTRALENVNDHLREALQEQEKNALVLKESEERFALAVEGSNSGIWDWFDVNGDAAWWSPQFYELLGYDNQEIEAGLTAFQEILHPDDIENTFKHLNASLKKGSTFNVEYRLKTKMGVYKWFRGKGVTKRSNEGCAVRMVGSISDIDRQKRAEESLLQYAEELEQAKNKAESGTRAKSEFLANMSHEIRTPMNSILGYAEILQTSSLTDDQNDQLNVIRNSGDRLLKLINNILDLSKIEAGHVELQYVSFSPEALIISVLELFTLQAREKNNLLTYDIDGAVPERLLGDEIRLQQLLVNLVSNAVKFTENGRIELSVYSQPLPKGQIRLMFRIEDNGVGIPDDKLNEIFNHFTQVDASDTRSFGGTGLGLAISQRLAEIMGGEIMVNSTLGRGSVFEVCVELASAPRRGEVVLVDKKKQVAATYTRPQSNKLNILLAEDDLSNQQLANHILSKLGHTVTIACNGQEAIDYLKANHYDVALMDIQMPGVDGLQVTKFVREEITAKEQPYIIAVTARTMQGERERFLSSGMDAYLSKPYTRDQLAEVLPALEPS